MGLLVRHVGEAVSARRDKAGGLVNAHGNLQRYHIERARAAGIGWTAVKVNSGEFAPDVGHIDQQKLTMLRTAFGADNVGGWGNYESHNDPIHSAWAVNGIITALGMKFYIANVEVPWADRVFLKELRRLQPSLVIWLSCEIENPRDWPAWFKVGEIKPRSSIAQAWLPQTYMNLNPPATPEQAVYFAQRKDLPPALIHWCPPEWVKPTFSVLGGNVDLNRDFNSLEDPDALALGLTPGFSIYLLENVLGIDQWNAITEAIKEGKALR